MMNRGACVALACAVLAVAPSVRAQEAPAAAGPDITPYVFLGSNASYGVGAAVRWPLPGAFSLELDTSYRRSAVSPLGANVSLLFDLPRVARVTPYVAGGIGLDQYALAETSANGHVVAQAGTAIAVNAGGGIRIRSAERWGVRTDARWSNGLGDRAPERWRVYNGVTVGRQGR